MKKSGLLPAVTLGILALASGGATHAQKLDFFAGYSFDNSANSIFENGAATNLHGYNVSATWNFSSIVGLEANFAGHHGSSTVFSNRNSSGTVTQLERQNDDTFTYLFGPKLKHAVGNKNFEVYTHFLVGASHLHQGVNETVGCSGTCNSSSKGTGFGLQTGGGVDWFHGKWGVRILEADYLRESASVDCTGTNFFCTGSGNTATFPVSRSNFRLATGVIFRWGHKE